jgi:hypothetical protein
MIAERVLVARVCLKTRRSYARERSRRETVSAAESVRRRGRLVTPRQRPLQSGPRSAMAGTGAQAIVEAQDLRHKPWAKLKRHPVPRGRSNRDPPRVQPLASSGLGRPDASTAAASAMASRSNRCQPPWTRQPGVEPFVELIARDQARAGLFSEHARSRVRRSWRDPCVGR